MEPARRDDVRLRDVVDEETARPLHADPVVGNTGSVRLLEKLGFQHAGTVRHGDNDHRMLLLGGQRPQE
jgi:RimJ/RimL family protein N-acetyltransferase